MPRRANPRYHPPVEQRITYQPTNHISLCVKYALFSFNFIFWLTGALIAGLGFWISFDVKDKQIRDALDVVFDPAILMCIAGLIIFLLGYCGCLGALRENICLLRTFHICLLLVFILEMLTCVVVVLCYSVPDIAQYLGFLNPESTLQSAIIKYRDDDDLRDFIDNIQREFECCGVSNSEEGFKDWNQNQYFNCSEQNPSVERCGVPHSCCRLEPNDLINVMCGFETTNQPRSDISHKIYTQGCLKGFGTWLMKNVILVGIIMLATMIPQLLGMCYARTLIQQIKLQKRQWQ